MNLVYDQLIIPVVHSLLHQWCHEIHFTSTVHDLSDTHSSKLKGKRTKCSGTSMSECPLSEPRVSEIAHMFPVRE
jgi:hypothetical protein